MLDATDNEHITGVLQTLIDVWVPHSHLQENRSGAQFPQQVFDPIEGLLFSNL
jgi:hypothetical protein